MSNKTKINKVKNNFKNNKKIICVKLTKNSFFFYFEKKKEILQILRNVKQLLKENFRNK